MHRRTAVLALGLLLASSDCAHQRRAPARGADVPVRVMVTNHFTSPVDVFAVGSGISHRLGLVHPSMSGEFVLPQTLIGGGTLELFAEAGGARARSGPLLLSPGAVVDFEITNPLFNSTATVRP